MQVSQEARGWEGEPHSCYIVLQNKIGIRESAEFALATPVPVNPHPVANSR